jgi:hypothetical protein
MVTVTVSIRPTIALCSHNTLVGEHVWLESATPHRYRAISSKRAAVYYPNAPSCDWLFSLDDFVEAAAARPDLWCSHELAHASLYTLGAHYLFTAVGITAAESLKRQTDRAQLAENMLLDALLAKTRIRSTKALSPQIATVHTPRQPNAPCSSVAA